MSALVRHSRNSLQVLTPKKWEQLCVRFSEKVSVRVLSVAASAELSAS